MRNDASFPCLEQPLRCFISSVNHNKRISCDPEGNISSSSNRKKWEEFYIMEEPNGIVKIRSVLNCKLITSSLNGHIKGVAEPSNEHFGEWYLQKGAKNDYYSFSSIQNTKYLACSNNFEISTIEEYDEENSSWDIEVLTGELCFISLSIEDKHLTCGPAGKIGMSKNQKGWEVWRLIEAGNGDVRISSWTHNHVLCDTANGKVISTEKSLSEKWKIEPAPDGFDGVVIKSCAHGRYLRSDGEQINTSYLYDGSLTTWHLSAGHSECYFISSLDNDKRIGCSKKNIFSTNNRKAWESWELRKLENGLVVFRSSAHKKFLSCDGYQLVARDEINDCGMWKLESTGKGVLIISKTNNRALSCDNDGNLSAAHKSDVTELWALEPCLPPTISKDQIIGLATGGAIAVASIAVMPFVVVGAIGALGFGGGGIAAGSLAAGMMSAEGTVMAGGVVATLQSIGAVGLGLTGTGVAMGGGAIVGASALGISVAASGVHKKKFEEGIDKPNPQEKRHFCNWREW